MHYFRLLPILLILILPCCVKIKVISPKRPKYQREFEAGKRVNAEDISRTIIIYAQDLRKKYKHLILEDSQAFFSGKKLTRVQMEFSTQDVIELREAREILVEVVEGFIRRFNGQNSILAMSGGGLKPENIDIYIDFESYHGVFVDPFYIGFMSLRKGLVSFYAFDFKDCWRDCWHKRLEYYWQSRNIVKYEQEYLNMEDKQKEKASFLDKDRFRISNKEAVQGTIQASPYDVFEKTHVPKAVIPMGNQVPILRSEIFDTSQETRPRKEGTPENQVQR
ncbi:putative uncharacterized protein [Parachlamydia acanthamoebae UV-7]|jgi:hypothetical protein|uniref:Uncharacterized protein n=2 Tax=Parachlamydia acanthamoebae TaxID=83552 RepID=F8KY46_PARAV|nr:hypothetical protein [Parachlamydia acanthamoebae]CCB87697.1 putative uncharacterized protein [Parachlamydia acanthamoebae UV-7]